ncbi:DMT family transporter [Paenisporosarcina indica]|uniref:DMT family transporter n=1 Tax=Paenisporosarcina indica TaxID=650093 RepID=UPI0009FDF61D|nr:DMT family transporter [Paenisporosarcina indica]
MFTKSTAALLSLIVIWGVSWPIYKLAVAYTPPLLFAGLRAMLGGLLLAAIIFGMRDKLNWRKNWMKYGISAFFNTILFFGLHTIGLIYLPGGLFSVLVYFQPVLLGLFAWIWLGENMTSIKMIGLIIGFLGIVVVSVDGLIEHISAIGVVLGLLTALFWAIGVIYVKKVSVDVDSFWMVAMQFTIGGVVLLAFGSFFESWSAIEWNAIFLFGLGWGATMGIPVAYVIYYKLVNSGDASKVGSYTFLVPVIAVYVSTVFLNEPVTFTLLTGLLLVVISIFLVNYRGKKGEVSLLNKAISFFHKQEKHL